MKNFTMGFALMMFISSIGLAQMPNDWRCYSTDYEIYKMCIGDINLRTVNESGVSSQSLWGPDAANINIAADSEYFLNFKIYKKGVTDLPPESGAPIWQMIDAKAETWDLGKNELIQSLPVWILKKNDKNENNVTYEIKINSLAPSVLTKIPESLKNGGMMKSVLRIIIDNKTVAYRFVSFTYNP